jgi:hypothetical protein
VTPWPIIPCETTHLVTLRFELDPGLTTDLLKLLSGSFAKIKRIETLTEQLMALTQETRDILMRLDVATTAIAAKLTALIAKVEELGLDAADEAEIVGIVTPIVATLEGMAHDPNNPVPPG